MKRKPPKNYRPVKIRACITCKDYIPSKEFWTGRIKNEIPAYCKRDKDFEIDTIECAHYEYICDYWKDTQNEK